MSTDSSAPDTTPADITQVTAPFPDEAYSSGTKARLAMLDVPGAGFGEMANLLAWAGRVQGTDTPGAFASVKTIVITAGTAGGMGAGGEDLARRVAQLRDGSAPIARLAAAAGTPVEIVEAAEAKPAEDGDTMSDEECLAALQQGADLADAAADSGIDLIVLGSLGEGLRTAAIALTAHATNAEAIAWLPRVPGAPGEYDDAAWMTRAAAVRDAMTHARPQARRAPVMLRALGGPAIAIATGLIVQAAVRRTPVLYDGPVAAAATIMARDITLGSPKWCYAPDHGPHATVAKVNDLVGYLPVFDLKMDLSEGATALTLLPVVNTVLTLSAALTARVQAPKVDIEAT